MTRDARTPIHQPPPQHPQCTCDHKWGSHARVHGTAKHQQMRGRCKICRKCKQYEPRRNP